MKVLQVTHLFAPDQLAGASLYTDLAKFFGERGHEVRVVASFPYYPALKLAESDRGVLLRKEMVEGARVRRIGTWLPQPHRGWRRLAPEGVYLATLTLAGMPGDWSPDVILTACPMLAQAAWQYWSVPHRAVPKILVVQDSMAHAATELGIIKNRWVGEGLHLFERWAFQPFDLHSTISPGMRERVREISGGRIPCVVTPNWIHSSLERLIGKRRAGLTGEMGKRSQRGGLFYSGNFGVKQGLPQFLELMTEARGPWKMAVHGGGAEADALKQAASARTDWLKVGGLLDETDYVDRLLSVGACVVTQMPGVGANFLPSKLLPALAAGAPVLALCERGSPLGVEVDAGQFGVVVEPGDRDGLRRVLARWAYDDEELNALGERSLSRAAHYGRDVICGRYESLLNSMHQHDRGKVL